ncbi:hypothetical protein K443DRAFT_11352 [Laccaria amethystina LaAM-08-1]|uniref:Uncharacterized protein n=1 Tax=Laccaria amethystina LaAM-08-1 TaxID=1095629 RepID=A0A0C9XHB6_9AGAR|nr:hypothetical protein K443DRAFT_11352 [Laccaria amethystina LaAM-08-1]
MCTQIPKNAPPAAHELSDPGNNAYPAFAERFGFDAQTVTNQVLDRATTRATWVLTSTTTTTTALDRCRPHAAFAHPRPGSPPSLVDTAALSSHRAVDHRHRWLCSAVDLLPLSFVNGLRSGAHKYAKVIKLFNVALATARVEELEDANAAYALFTQILHPAPDLSFCIEDDDDKMLGSDRKSVGGITASY